MSFYYSFLKFDPHYNFFFLYVTFLVVAEGYHEVIEVLDYSDVWQQCQYSKYCG